MTDQNLIEKYNYDSFVRKNFEPWMNFDNSPVVGQPAPDFPLWHLNGDNTSLSTIWSNFDLTVIEFGSFT